MDPNAMVDAHIVMAVRELASDKRLGCAVLPFDVWSFGDEFGIYAVEGTIRRRMARLADRGRLLRVGGEGSRRGYMVADWRRLAKRVPDVVAFPVPVFAVRYGEGREVG